tara:strand:- start:97 stop:705 length:609 start_codon:yes stop_codon:yes gene_type:complete
MSKKELANEEWDFSPMEKAPRTMIQRALLWEMDRELGSGREPYMKSAEYRRGANNGFKGSASGVVEVGKANEKTLPFEDSFNFRIDWSQPREELEEQFSEWLESKEQSGKMMEKPTLGKPREALTMLRKMSIVRLKANGYSLRTAGQIFPEKKRFVESLQKINWTTASREVDKALNRRRNNLKTIERSVTGKNWKTGLYENA